MCIMIWLWLTLRSLNKNQLIFLLSTLTECEVDILSRQINYGVSLKSDSHCKIYGWTDKCPFRNFKWLICDSLDTLTRVPKAIILLYELGKPKAIPSFDILLIFILITPRNLDWVIYGPSLFCTIANWENQHFNH